MHKFLFTTCLFLFFTTTLSAQYPEWDNHLLINSIKAGTETSTDVWCLTQSSLLKINKESKELSVYQNAETGFGANPITSIWADANDRVYYVSNHLGYYENNQWHKHETLQLLQNQPIKKILGKDETGKFYFLTYNGQLMSWEIGQPIELMSIPQGSADEALMDENGKIWLMGLYWIGSWENGVFELSILEEFPRYFLNIQFGYEEDEIWARGPQYIYYKKNDTWHVANFQELFGLTNLLLVKPIAPQKALVITNNQGLFITRFHNGYWAIENITTTLPENNLPSSSFFADNSGTIWYINGANKNLEYWQQANGVSKIAHTPWPTVSDINTLALDPAGRIWLGGSNGLNYLHGGKWHQWEPARHNQFNFGLNELIFTDQSELLVAAQDGIIKWEEETGLWEHIDMTGLSFEGQAVKELTQDRNNNIWTIGTAQNTFAVLSNGHWFEYTPTDIPFFSASTFSAFAEASDGSMWIGTNRGVLNYDGFKFTNFDFRDLQLSTAVVANLFVDSKGHLWVAMSNSDVLKWDGEFWQHFSGENTGLLGTTWAIEEGNNGEMWFASNWGGVVRFDSEEWTRVTSYNDGLHSFYIEDIQKDARGRIWFAGGNGVSVYDEGNTAQIPVFELTEEQNIAVLPNPGCCVFQVNWQQNEAGKTAIELYNIQGQKLRILFDNEIEAGEQELLFNRDDLPSGVYTIVVRQSNKMLSELLIIN